MAKRQAQRGRGSLRQKYSYAIAGVAAAASVESMSRRGFIQVVRRVGTTPSMKALVECQMDEARVAFGAFAAGFYLLGNDEHPVEIHVAGLPDRFIDGYERYGREVDPLFEAMLENHEPVHERCLFQREDQWVKQPLFVRCSAEYDVGHYLLGPIVANGRLIDRKSVV